MGRIATLLMSPVEALIAARGILFPWVPVFLGLGIGIWFSLRWEPGGISYALCLVLFIAAVGVRLRGPEPLHPFAIAVACMLLGGLAAGYRAYSLTAPILGFRFYGAVEGRIVLIDRSQSDKIRLTLDQVILENTPPQRTPERVRVSLHGVQDYLTPEPGQRVMATAHLAAPDGPVEPDGFDFRRIAFFDRLGAVGYTRAPVLLLEPPAPGAQQINRLRNQIRQAVQARIPGEAGSVSAALMTGDRAGISQSTTEALRASNLSHLLAISGLHMGLLAGFVFAALRYGLALVPVLALRINTKKTAAVVALIAGFVYLLLSGGSVATERAYVMVAVMLGAVLFDRRALSLRSVAMAATVLLLAQPETLLEPGFQMSFAATIALVAGYGALRGRGQPHRMPFWVAPVFTLVFTSLIAGLATAPIAAAHFNRIAGYGLIANFLAVPLMGTAVMPAAVFAALAAPFGLEALPLWVMEPGTRWILGVAHWVTSWEGAQRAVPTPPWMVLPILSFGFLWLVLWRGPVRFWGLAPMVASFGLWVMAERPIMLLTADAGLLGLKEAGPRALSAERRSGFAAGQWLENDGDLSDQAQAALRFGAEGSDSNRPFLLGGLEGVILRGKEAEAQANALCDRVDLVIVSAYLEDPPRGRCHLIDRTLLDKTGALAVRKQGGHLVVEPTQRAQRLWSPKEPVAPWLLPNPGAATLLSQREAQ